jgi:hypothetical protein
MRVKDTAILSCTVLCCCMLQPPVLPAHLALPTGFPKGLGLTSFSSRWEESLPALPPPPPLPQTRPLVSLLEVCDCCQ